MASPYGNFGAIPDVGNIDLGKLGSKRGPDYVPYNAKGRDSLARVSFNTGIMWLGGYVSGGLYGFVEGWRGAASPNYKIRFNSVMNAFSKRGSYLGNSLGIIGFVHTVSSAGLDYVGVEQYIDSQLTVPVLSGMLTGGIFRSGSTPRAVALASVIGGGVSVAYSFAGDLVNFASGRKGRF